MAPPRVLSVQSSVVSGYVGNKCAVFPLQLLGFDVDPVSTVQFSNHTGYPVVRGKVFEGGHLAELVQGMEANGLLRHTHLLTGYIGSLSLLQAVADVARKLRLHAPGGGFTYVCDPVLGDEGQLYVARELVDAYRDHLLPLADVLTPNAFEAELLSGREVRSEAQALEACGALHAAGPATVVITSAVFRGGGTGEPGSAEEQRSAAGGAAAAAQPQQQQQQQHGEDAHITLVASTRLPQRPGRPSAFSLSVPRVEGYFTGTGDLLAALLLGWLYRHPDDLATAVEAAVAGLQGVLRATAAAAGHDALTSRERSAEVFRARELRLVENQQLLQPQDLPFKARPLEPAPPPPPPPQQQQQQQQPSSGGS